MIGTIKKYFLNKVLASNTAKAILAKQVKSEININIVEYDKLYFKSIKNKYKGRAGFVIGNGPSLRIKNLDKLGPA